MRRRLSGSAWRITALFMPCCRGSLARIASALLAHVACGTLTDDRPADRDRPDTYLNIIEFESYESAMEDPKPSDTSASLRGRPSSATVRPGSTTSTSRTPGPADKAEAFA
jgi:hypothetical protein